MLFEVKLVSFQKTFDPDQVSERLGRYWHVVPTALSAVPRFCRQVLLIPSSMVPTYVRQWCSLHSDLQASVCNTFSGRGLVHLKAVNVIQIREKNAALSRPSCHYGTNGAFYPSTAPPGLRSPAGFKVVK